MLSVCCQCVVCCVRRVLLCVVLVFGANRGCCVWSSLLQLWCSVVCIRGVCCVLVCVAGCCVVVVVVVLFNKLRCHSLVS